MKMEETMRKLEEEKEDKLHQSLCENEEERVERNEEVKYSFISTPSTNTKAYKKGGWGARHTLVLLACVGVILMSMMRYGLSMAIVSMVTRPAADHHHQYSTNTTATNITATPFLTNVTTFSSTGMDDGGVCFAPDVDGVDGGVNGTFDGVYNDSITRFEWDEKAQGHVLGAFYYGYFLTNILGGRLAERVGSKPVILVGMLLSSLLSLVSPLAAHLSTGMFIGVRLVQGFAQDDFAGSLLDAFKLAALRDVDGGRPRWGRVCQFGEDERGVHARQRTLRGPQRFESPQQGVLVPAFNRCLVMWVPPYKRSKYNTFVFIGSEVGIVLSMTVGGYFCSQPSVGSWTAVFYVFGGAGMLWCVAWWVVARESPLHHNGMSAEEKKYLTAHCVVQQEQNGIVSALPYVAETTFALLFCVAVDRATASGRLSVLAVRRLAMAVASYIPAAALVGMCLVGCDSVAAVGVVCVAIGAGGSAFCGLFSSHQDLAPNLAGTLLGVTNSIANVMGFLAPALVGVITFRNQTVWAWNTVFLLSAAIYLLSATFYITCVTDKVQPFNDPAQVQDGHVEEVKVEKPGEGKHAKQLPLPEAS
ncbi:sialin-like isoform X2 [Eriocheir sinensis]|uniref:sialin-like isoform X2 n=1 Tax=Eriocheir sinensis TaxID=95602 RepID=UPI0021CAA42B|nr:sialin-like isoform X2 [Eriocheir sinensis]